MSFCFFCLLWAVNWYLHCCSLFFLWFCSRFSFWKSWFLVVDYNVSKYGLLGTDPICGLLNYLDLWLIKKNRIWENTGHYVFKLFFPVHFLSLSPHGTPIISVYLISSHRSLGFSILKRIFFSIPVSFKFQVLHCTLLSYNV